MTIDTPQPSRKKTKRRKTTTPAHILATHTIEAILSKKGSDIAVIDLRTITGVADFFVLCTGDSDLQIKAIADAVRQTIRAECDELPWHMEGYESRRWVLLDYVDVVVHIFDAERRAFYDLERLWADAPIEQATDEDPAITFLQPETSS
jgi:ribosome-associated protein